MSTVVRNEVGGRSDVRHSAHQMTSAAAPRTAVARLVHRRRDADGVDQVAEVPRTPTLTAPMPRIGLGLAAEAVAGVVPWRCGRWCEHD